MDLSSAAVGLWVLHDDVKIGRLAYLAEDNLFSFIYESEWVERRRFWLSPHIRADRPAPTGSVTRFLENLLPEGDGLRRLAQISRVNQSNLYGLIAAIGGETTGALTIAVEPKAPATLFRPVARDELVSRIKDRRRTPIGSWDGKPRLSVAGVQEKLPIVERAGEFGLGEGQIASTHILKFGNDRAEHLVINEFFCMNLARAAGLQVADCEVLALGERVLNVRRFDRIWEGTERVRRIHLIDGCQALDLSPTMKYERFLGDQDEVADIMGPATLKNIYGFCSQASVPAKAKIEILRWVAFNLLIGNGDNHLKNVSFFVEDGAIRLAPFYDLASVSMYPDLEQALAFQIGETFRPEEVNAYHLAVLAAELGLKKPFVAEQFRRVAQSVLRGLVGVDVGPCNDEEARFLDRLKAETAARGERFLRELPQIAKFKSV